MQKSAFYYINRSKEIIREKGFIGLVDRLISTILDKLIIPLRIKTLSLFLLPYNKLLHHKHISNAEKIDIIMFSIINWETRFQRPQQIILRLASKGHRCFYISVNLKRRQKYRVRQIKSNIFEIILPYKYNTTIYNEPITQELNSLNKAFYSIINDFSIKEALSIVEYPMWQPIVDLLKKQYSIPILVDHLDHYSGFSNVYKDIQIYEESLLLQSDLTVVTADNLYTHASQYSKKTVIINNGTDYEYFSILPQNSLLSGIRKPIIGYYGAVAEWFDVELIKEVAISNPGLSIVIIGEDTINAKKRLCDLKNIIFIGEVPFNKLTQYVYWFDVCIIPFVINELIVSTNPVKFYEYISSGKPVVATDIPELYRYRNICYISKTYLDFNKNISKALNENSDQLIKRRVEVAKKNDWNTRVYGFINCFSHIFPKVSIIMVTYNNCDYTINCINSILSKTAYPNYELIIVDNDSTDDTRDYLKSIDDARIKILLNDKNYGFASANNLGIRKSNSEYIILLNNDTVITRGWLSGLLRHFSEPNVGMVGPVTNNIGNEAKITIDYNSIEKMDHFADKYTCKNLNRTINISVLAMFCVAIKREVIDNIGLLDERFGIGMFEDDDYSLRVRNAGYIIKCVKDVYIHHIGNASFKKMNSTEYNALFMQNQIKYEEKWGLPWKRHDRKT